MFDGDAVHIKEEERGIYHQSYELSVYHTHGEKEVKIYSLYATYAPSSYSL